jgi:pilus assembly protein Flp/PilA
MSQKKDLHNDKKVVQTDSSGFLADESGQGMVEYGLILGLVAMICLMSITSLGSSIYNLFFRDLKNNINTNT